MGAAYNDGPTSRSLEPAETLDIEAENANNITNLHQYFKNQNNGKPNNGQ
jgi:hypothetical protein